jgi:hypothetical protein
MLPDTHVLYALLAGIMNKGQTSDTLDHLSGV